MTPISKTLEQVIRGLYQDGNVSVTEYRQLRDNADRRTHGGGHQRVWPAQQHHRLQKAMDVAMQLLQLSVIDAKKAQLTDTGEAIVKDAVVSQVEYLRAGSELALHLL